MGDSWECCPNCGKIDTLRHIMPMYAFWNEEEQAELSKRLYCVYCQDICLKVRVKEVIDEWN